MKCINALIIDDEEVDNLFDGVEGINVESCKPEDFTQDMAVIRKSKFDAIIMDQKLTNQTKSIPYQGTTLIQEMRSRMVKSNGDLSPKPIVLWSIAKNIETYYNEKSSHNLTDAVWRKDNFGQDEEYAQKCVETLWDLVSGYKLLNTLNPSMSAVNHLLPILNVKKDNASIIPYPFYVFFDNKSNRKPHLISQFVLNSILRFNGPLIDFETVLARLGVSDKSKDLAKLKQKLDKFSYKGIYSASNPRWWFQLLTEWWLDKIDTRHPAPLTAFERTKLLRSKLKLDLEPAEVPNGQNSASFWYSCPFTKQPLDPIDSFKVVFPEKREWQDDIYISYDAAKNRDYKRQGYSLDPTDKDRLLRRIRA